jgi:hypothetical protein
MLVLRCNSRQVIVADEHLNGTEDVRFFASANKRDNYLIDRERGELYFGTVYACQENAHGTNAFSTRRASKDIPDKSPLPAQSILRTMPHSLY